MHSSLLGPLSTSESDKESDPLSSTFASFTLSLLAVLCAPLTVASTTLEPFKSEAEGPEAAGRGGHAAGEPASCSFFLIKSRADEETGAAEVRRTKESRPPVCKAGALKLTGVDPLSDPRLTFCTGDAFPFKETLS